MNIKEAKTQITNAMEAYFEKDDLGTYIIPVERQRPIFMMGPPGIGKTAIMEQVAAEKGVALISYSMTHHTRQSAIGLPFISHKTYGGKEYDVSEYTMSEIIASVYDMMEETGMKEGILFLDEINCVSETLAPVMLQFLQYKVFGRHRVPEGWVVVTAGNPPEYNNSVREFDVVTWDRLKRIDVEPDFETWKEYAFRKGIHPSVITYLEIRKGDFYRIETTVDGKSFVTARGWSDLSDMIHLYERKGIKVDQQLVAQYVQNSKIAKEFAVYYDLFNKYKADYQIDSILNGTARDSVVGRAISAKFDERLALLSMLIDAVSNEMKDVGITEKMMDEYMKALVQVRTALMSGRAGCADLLAEQAGYKNERLAAAKTAGSISDDDARASRLCIAALEEQRAVVMNKANLGPESSFKLIKEDFDKRTKELKKKAKQAGKWLENIFDFCEKAFGEGNELLILVTDLTANVHTSRFISRYGSDAYFRHNKQLLFFERQKEILTDLELLDL
ncbi:MAG: AAA family ATPase [Clostridia bacterium]|nr:AAA family ATPase [Clostridia bacterium]